MCSPLPKMTMFNIGILKYFCVLWLMASPQSKCVRLPRAITRSTIVWIVHQLCDLHTSGVIAHGAHRELKGIMRFVNKRQPFWQRLTHLPSSMVSFDRCVCMCVSARYQQDSNKLPSFLIAFISDYITSYLFHPPNFYHFPGVGSQGKQPKQVEPNFCLPGYIV